MGSLLRVNCSSGAGGAGLSLVRGGMHTHKALMKPTWRGKLNLAWLRLPWPTLHLSILPPSPFPLFLHCALSLSPHLPPSIYLTLSFPLPQT